MEIYNKAKELAASISQSDELKKMRETEANMMCDPLARKLVEEYQQKQMEAMQKGVSFDQLPVEEQKELEKIEENMSQNENIVAYMEAQEALEKVLRSVNLIISSALNENEGACPSSGCSSCSTCG
ncbi:MAG: YlbF family regulator [Bacillota bacterium]